MSLKSEVDNIIRELENSGGGGVPVMFYDRSCYMEQESKESGRPVYKTVTYVKKHKDNLSVYDSFARAEDIKQFPKQYEIYKANKKAREEGVPVGMLPGITPAQVSRCEVCRIFTVESLSTADESVILDLGDKTLRDRAVAYLNGQSEKDIRIEELEKQLKELQNDNTEHHTGRGGRGQSVRAATDDNRERKSRGQAGAKLPENNQ